MQTLNFRGTWHEGVAQGQQVAQHVIVQAPRARRLWGGSLKGVALPAPPHGQHVGLQLPVCLPHRQRTASAWQGWGLLCPVLRLHTAARRFKKRSAGGRTCLGAGGTDACRGLPSGPFAHHGMAQEFGSFRIPWLTGASAALSKLPSLW